MEGSDKRPPYDHCKHSPGIVNVSQLVEYTKREAEKGEIDDFTNLARARIFVFEGTEDTLYRGNANYVSTSWNNV